MGFGTNSRLSRRKTSQSVEPKGAHALITRAPTGPSPLVPRDPPGGRVMAIAKQRQLTHESVFTITPSASVGSVPSVADSEGRAHQQREDRGLNIRDI